MELTIDAQKNILRKRFRLLRDSIPEARRREDSRIIWDHFLAGDLYRKARRILLYLNFGSEVETLPYLERIRQDGKRIAAPCCQAADRSMTLYEFASAEQLCPGTYGILEPDPDRGAFCTEVQRGDLMIVPALAFDRKGNRLGYGAGYYDRFLANGAPVTVGFAFSCCVGERLPCDERDRRVSALITETGREFFDG